jgi:hypothetical protein
MKKGRYFGTTPDVSRKGVFWRIAIFSILASMLIAGTASSLLVQNAYAANTLVINAVALDGRALNMWTTISSGGSVVRSGLTPLTFAGTTGATYSVTVSDYGSIFFDHWDNGNTARTRTLILNADMTITASYRTGPTHSLVVNSADMAGSALNGFYTIIRAGTATVRTGFTSLSFAGNHDTSYSVTVSDYGTRVFDHWNDGSTARTRTIALNADTTVTAHYRSNALTYTLTVNTVGPSGSALTGYYTTVREGSTTVKTGFTPLTYQGKSGASLVTTVSDYGDMVFDHWENGSAERVRAITLGAHTTITATYKQIGGPTKPTAVDDSATTDQNVATTVSVLANDSDPDGGNLTIASTTDPANGSAAINGDGTITYTPDSGFVGTDAFDYVLSDGNVETDVATVTVAVGQPVVTHSLVVQSVNMAGTIIPGHQATVQSGDMTIQTGITTLTFVGNAGTSYTISVSDTGNMVFDHWDDGSTARTRTLTLNADMTITAYYKDTAPKKTGVYVALYMYPIGTQAVHWQKVIDEKTKHPSVPIVATFNPNSGPGNAKDNNIASWVNKMKQAGVVMIGYTYDDYGSRSLTALKADADKYKNWYNADGVFIDEFTNKAGFEGHYRDLTTYVKSIGMKMTMGNPGTDVPRSYIGTVDVINITEGRGYMPISWLQYCIGCNASNGWHYQHDKSNFAYMRYDISTLDTAFETESAKWVGLLLITNGNDSNGRWFSLPPYFSTLVETLDR